MRRDPLGHRLRLTLTLLTSLLLLLFSPAVATAQSYAIDAVAIEATVTPDGALVVEERRTLRFTDSWSWWEQWIPVKSHERLIVESVGEPGRPYQQSDDALPGTYQVQYDDPENPIIKWHYQVTDDVRTFVLRYRIENAVTVHNDVAELYRGFVGDDWDQATDRVNITLNLPPGAEPEQVRAWGHGPLQGEVRIVSGARVEWHLGSLPSYTFVESRVLFPTALVPQATHRTGKVAEQEILAAEEAWANEANLNRLLARFDIGLAFVALLGAAALVAVLRSRQLGRGPPSTASTIANFRATTPPPNWASFSPGAAPRVSPSSPPHSSIWRSGKWSPCSRLNRNRSRA